MKISFDTKYNKKKAIVALNIQAGKLDKVFKGLEKSIKTLGFKGGASETATLTNECGFPKLHIAGFNKIADNGDLRNLGGNIYKLISSETDVQISVDNFKNGEIVQIAYGLLLASYSFDKYKTVKKPKKTLKNVIFVGKNAKDSKKCFGNLEKVASGVFLARDLVNEPANTLTPAEFTKHAKALSKFGVKVKILDETALKKLGMGALLGVGQGSVNKSYVAVMEYNGGTKSQNPFVFVGKGVTFDTGGISIKPAGGMEDMKFDMGGAAAVIGAVKAIASRKAKANVVGVLGLVENMPDGNAQRPGDVVKSMSGQTIEIINTDAEGRLVLGDCLTYVQKQYKPKCIIDLATLTGAIMVGLGFEYAGVFTNDDDLSSNIIKASESEFEGMWKMPMHENYNREMDSTIADMKNAGGRWAGACTAAAFLGRFVDKKVPWAHIDIAGMAWEYKGRETTPRGGVGFAVKTLDRIVWDFEKSNKK